jgi:cholinesterase
MHTHEELYTSILQALPSSSVIGLTNFGPTIDNAVIFSDYLTHSSAGNFIKKLMLLGNAD